MFSNLLFIWKTFHFVSHRRFQQWTLTWWFIVYLSAIFALTRSLRSCANRMSKLVPSCSSLIHVTGWYSVRFWNGWMVCLFCCSLAFLFCSILWISAEKPTFMKLCGIHATLKFVIICRSRNSNSMIEVLTHISISLSSLFTFSANSAK